LRFDDEDMERELGYRTIDTCYYVLTLFVILDVLCRALFPLNSVMFDPASFGTATAIAYTCITVTYVSVLILVRYMHSMPKHKAAMFKDRVWTIAWTINIVIWWFMLHCGLARRLTAAQGQAAAICCAMWTFVMVLQHTLHIEFRCRMFVMLMASSIAFTSVAWQKEVLGALIIGEAVGYSMEHMTRSSYLPRAKSLKQMRNVPERGGKDILMLRTKPRSDQVRQRTRQVRQRTQQVKECTQQGKPRMQCAKQLVEQQADCGQIIKLVVC